MNYNLTNNCTECDFYKSTYNKLNKGHCSCIDSKFFTRMVDKTNTCCNFKNVLISLLLFEVYKRLV